MHISFTVNIKLCRAYELVMLCLVGTLCSYQLEVDYMHTMYSYLFRPESDIECEVCICDSNVWLHT